MAISKLRASTRGKPSALQTFKREMKAADTNVISLKLNKSNSDKSWARQFILPIETLITSGIAVHKAKKKYKKKKP